MLNDLETLARLHDWKIIVKPKEEQQ